MANKLASFFIIILSTERYLQMFDCVIVRVYAGCVVHADGSDCVVLADMFVTVV